MYISAKLKVSASKSATSPSCEPLAETLKKIVDKNTFFLNVKTFEIKIKTKEIWQ